MRSYKNLGIIFIVLGVIIAASGGFIAVGVDPIIGLIVAFGGGALAGIGGRFIAKSLKKN